MRESLQTSLREHQGPRIAAFDADGTLWDADAGETFFDWQIHNSKLANMPADPWKHYLDLKKPDPRVGYVWLAQINQGHPLAQVREWAKQCFDEMSPWPVFESQQKLIAELKSLDFEVFIVTASIKWAVEPFASLVGIDYDHVIGIETEVRDGIVTNQPKLPLTWREGKAQGLLTRTGGVRPLLACGNTYGDTALLESATHLRLAVSTQNENTSLHEEEEKLAVAARANGWLQHPFRSMKDE